MKESPTIVLFHLNYSVFPQVFLFLFSVTTHTMMGSLLTMEWILN